MDFVTGAEILTYVGVKNPTSEDTAWAEACASAVNDGITVRLNGVEIMDPGIGELHTAAIMAGGETYKRREAPFGITGFHDLEGNAIRISRDYIDSIAPIISRYSVPGIG